MTHHTYEIPGALMDQLLAHIGNHPQRMELYATLSAYKQAQDVADKQSHANSLYVLGYDAEGHRVVAHMRSAQDAQQDSDVMTQFLELEQAMRLRGVVIPPRKVGALWVMSVLPPGGLIVDPWAGSGSTGVAAVQEGFGFIGFERELEHANVANARIAHARAAA